MIVDLACAALLTFSAYLTLSEIRDLRRAR